MYALLLRLLFALVLPPLIGGLILFLVEISRGNRPGGEIVAGATHALLFFWIAGFVFCCLPGLVYWGGLEMYWRRKGPVLKPRFAIAGALLGTICGVALGVALGQFKASSVLMAAIFVITGTLAGLVTALAIFWTRRPKVSADRG